MQNKKSQVGEKGGESTEGEGEREGGIPSHDMFRSGLLVCNCDGRGSNVFGT